jgi:hypothetical protein
MHINELKLWYKQQNFFDQKMLYFIEQKILYMETMINIYNKRYFLSVKKLFKINSFKKKLNIIIFLLMPNFILKELKNNFS